MEYLKYSDEIERDVQQDDSASFEEKMIIYSIIRATKPDICVETGTHKGKTALYIAQALYDNKKGHLWTVDPNEDFAREAIRYFDRYPELKKFITFRQIEGKDLKIKNIDFIFIDSFHEKEVVLEEMRNFLPGMNKGAMVLFHDCGGDNESVGVNAAIDELKLKTVMIPTENVMRIYSHQRSVNLII